MEEKQKWEGDNKKKGLGQREIVGDKRREEWDIKSQRAGRKKRQGRSDMWGRKGESQAEKLTETTWKPPSLLCCDFGGELV